MPALHVTYSVVPCPYCGRGVGLKCVDGFGRELDKAHYSRTGKAMGLRSSRANKEQKEGKK